MSPENRQTLLEWGAAMSFATALASLIGATALAKGSYWAAPLVAIGVCGLIGTVVCVVLFSRSPASQKVEDQNRNAVYYELGAYLAHGERLAWWLDASARIQTGDLSRMQESWGEPPEDEVNDLAEWRRELHEYLARVVSEPDAAMVFSTIDDPLPETPSHMAYPTDTVRLWKNTQQYLRRLRVLIERYQPR